MKPRIAVTVAADDLARGHSRQTYRAAVEQAGGEPVLVSEAPAEGIHALLASFDGLLLPGGNDLNPDTYGGRPHESVRTSPPALDALELEAARFAKRSGIPTLAICRGLQVVNVALGGTLYEDIGDQYISSNGLRLRHNQTPDHGRKDTTHDVMVLAGSRLSEVVGGSALATNSLHHQAVRRVAYDLVPTARTHDGIVEALELRTDHPFFMAVQWHPEELVDRDEPSRRLFSRFVAAASARAAGRNAQNSG